MAPTDVFRGGGFSVPALRVSLFSRRRYTQAEDLLDTCPLLSFPAGARVLDLCCGPGVFTVPLADRGCDVTGVDLSPAMLERARKRSADTGAQVRYVQADAREYEAPGAFDVVLNMFTSFGYFEDPAEQRPCAAPHALLSGPRRHARPGPRRKGTAGPQGHPAQGGAAAVTT